MKAPKVALMAFLAFPSLVTLGASRPCAIACIPLLLSLPLARTLRPYLTSQSRTWCSGGCQVAISEFPSADVISTHLLHPRHLWHPEKLPTTTCLLFSRINSRISQLTCTVRRFKTVYIPIRSDPQYEATDDRRGNRTLCTPATELTAKRGRSTPSRRRSSPPE